MTSRTEALEIARKNLAAHSAERLHFTFKVWAVMTDIIERDRLDREIDAKHGYRHGWFKVGEFNFSREEITGEAYDHTQGGWAWL